MTPRPGPDRGEPLVSARPLAEYRAMFALTDDDLRGRVLDCPGGGSSFAAETEELGIDVTAVDPTYDTPVESLGPHVVEEVDRGNQYVRDNPHLYVWSWFRDADHHRELRREGARRFSEHYGAGSERYVVAALPDLPLADRSFDLTLSSHLLFTYSDRMDDAFHLSAMREMVRVTREEVRIFPLVDIHADRHARLDQLRSAMAERGIDSEVRRVEYEFQRGGNELLALRPDEDRGSGRR